VNKFQSFSDKSSKDQGLSRLGKVKHQKRKEEQAAGLRAVKAAEVSGGDKSGSKKLRPMFVFVLLFYLI